MIRPYTPDELLERRVIRTVCHNRYLLSEEAVLRRVCCGRGAPKWGDAKLVLVRLMAAGRITRVGGCFRASVP